MTHIESPCCLHLGFTRTGQGAPLELGIALQHPPIQLTARPASQLIVSGARAEVAMQHAASLNFTGEIEIEIAIPAFMGLGSDDMMRESVQRAAENPPRVSETLGGLGLHAHAFAQGGLLLMNAHGDVHRRATISHACEDDDWVFVLALPHAPDGIADDFEAQQRAALRHATQHLPTFHDDVLFDTVTHDDFNAFADALAEIHVANEAALAASGQPIELTGQDRDILDFMRANGAVMCGRALTGLGLYSLIKGGPASRNLRKALTDHLGYFGPLVMASICDNQGASTNRSG